MIHAINTAFFVGHLRPAPGTWGSLVAVLIGWAIEHFLGFPVLLILTVAITALGFWSVGQELRGRPGDDPSEIVIDEVAGQWLALLFPSYGFWHAGLPSTEFPWPGWLAAFLFFRLFDIWKPSIIGRADRESGTMGVMMDDLWAGVFAGISVMICAGIYHGLIA